MLEPDFVRGVISFIDTWDKQSRIVIPVSFGNRIVDAIVDTGAPYSLLAPDVADEIGIDRSAGLPFKISTRLGTRDGWLCRVPVKLEATVSGTGIEFETTVFVPDDGWPPDRNFIGLNNFLFRMCFVVDPRENLFYFSEPI